MNRLAKLVTMDPREIAYRVHEKLRSETERFRYHAGMPSTPADELFANFKTYLEQKAEPRFYFRASGAERDRRLNHIQTAFPGWMDRTVQEAERICRHKVQLLSIGERPLGDIIDWHRDPLTGKSWPRRFWSDYDPVHDATCGDAKVIHELNRHQHIVTLAKAYFFTGYERYAREAVSQLLSWIDQNPTSIGINWQSSLEIGIRAVSWIWVLFLVLPSRALTDKAAAAIGRSLFAQLDHIDRFPSLFSSPNTHIIGEAAALFIAGTIFDGLEQASTWQRRGADWLTREMALQVGSDGVHGELSTYYHCYTVDFYMQALTLAKAKACEFPGWMYRRLEDMLEFVLYVTRNDGTLPLLGDDDGGRALAIVGTNYQRPGFDEEMFWLSSNDRSLLSVPPKPTQHAFYPNAGYGIQRSGWDKTDTQVIFDCGGLGILNGGHAHADALALVMNIGGTEILTDPGTHLYNGAPEWRNFFRSTRAHNTVVVDETDQSIPDGTFKWSKRAQCSDVRHLSGDRFDYLEAAHDGYRDAPQPITHRRGVLYIEPDLWVVTDGFEGPAAAHTFDSYFHFCKNARLEVKQDDDCVVDLDVAAEAARLQIFMSSSAPIQPIKMEGWVSSLYGEKSSAPTLQLRMSSAAPANSLFIMLPGPIGSAVRSIDLIEGTALASVVEHGHVKDVFVSSLRDEEISLPDFNLRGRFFWLRLTAGLLTNVLGIDCKEVRYRGDVLMRDENVRTYFEYR